MSVTIFRKFALALGLPILLAGSQAWAQTNGTWSLSGGGNWGAAGNWLGGNIPDNGGIATFDNFQGQLSNIGVTVDTTSRTLSEIRFDQQFTVSISASGGASINIAGGNLTLNSIASTISSPNSFFNTVNGISAPITGFGNLVKTGVGNVAISGANTFAGNVQINQGALWLTAANPAAQDAALGNAANSIVMNGGILGISGQALTTARTLTVNAGGGTVRNFAGSTFTGTVNGSGTFATQISGGTTWSGNASGFTGGLRIDGGSAFTLSGTAALGGSSTIVVGGGMTLNNATNVDNRLNGRSVDSWGGVFTMAGNAAINSTENAGQLSLSSGMTTITFQPTVSASTVVSFTSLNRVDRSTIYVRGTGLGGTLNAPNTSNLVITSQPVGLVGGGGDPITSTNASIIPYMIGSTTNNVTSGAPLTFVTWDGATQRIVPLNTTTGYATDLSTAANADNVNLLATSSVNLGGQTINSLRFSAGGLALNGNATDTLTVASGAILSTSSTATINAPLNFGNAEGVLHAAGALTINGTIAGTNGITKSGVGTLTLNGANTYTGLTTLTAGNTTVAGGVVTADGSAPSVFGQDTSAIRMLSSNNTAPAATRLWTSGNLVINRDMQIKLGGAQTTGIGTLGATANESVVINGNVALLAQSNETLARFLSLEGGDNVNESVTINGVVSGNGGLRANFGAYTVLGNTNTYSGGTLIGVSSISSGTGVSTAVNPEVWEIRTNNAFGTGTVFVHNVANTVQPASASGIIRTGGSAPISLSNDIVMVQGFATFDGTQALTLNGNLFTNGAASNNSVINVNSVNAPVTLNGTIAGGGIIKNGAGTLVLNANNTYSGQTIIRQGVLSVSNLGNGGTAGNLGQGPNAANRLVLSGNAAGDYGTLRYTGAGESSDRSFTMQGTGGTIDASGTGALVLSNTGAIGQGFGNVNLSGLALNANAGVISVSTSTAAQLVVGSVITSAAPGLVPAGTVVTEVGQNFIRLNNQLTNTAALSAQTLTFTLPGTVTNRRLNLIGSNTGLNTLAGTLVNGTLPVQVVKGGTGTWQLVGDNTYSGGTIVSSGTLVVNNTTGSGLGTGSILVEAAGTLAGAGTVLPGTTSTVVIDGTVAPGNSAGTLTFGSAANLTSVDLNGTFDFELATAGTGNVAFDSGLSSPGLAHLNHDVLNVFGSLDLTGATIDVSAFAGTGFDLNQSYSWLIATTNGGTLTALPTLGFVGGGDFVGAPAANFFFGSNGSDLYLNFQAVPEPGTWTVLLALGLGWGWRRRRDSQIA